MSDLHKRNTDAMISHAKQVSAELHELKQMIVAQNEKISTLAQELASVKKQRIIDAVAAQVEEKGHGGTA